MLHFITTFFIYIILLKLQKKTLIYIDKLKLEKYDKLVCDEILCL